MAAGQDDAEKLESWIDDTREKIFKVREAIEKKSSKWGLTSPPPYFSELWNRWGTFHISYGGHMGVIWGSYGGHMRII